jgi:NAD(P)-dependent dehydrogenase (short-subunit alcohol dehydrogenase family)
VALTADDQLNGEGYRMVERAGRVDGKVAIVTGAGSTPGPGIGTGKATAVVLAREGASVLLVDLHADRADETRRMIEDEGGKAQVFAADVTSAADCEAMVGAAERAYGRLDVLFNNAGVMLSSDDDALTTDEGTWDTTMDINAKGVFLGCKYGIPALQRAGGGAIVNTASFVAKMGAATSQVAYTASKGAVLAFSRELAVIHARDGIRVNALCPGPLRTEMLMKFLDTDEKRNRRLVHIPMGRFGEAAEIAKAALFLASDDASFMTGAELVVDGGITAAYVTPQ